MAKVTRREVVLGGATLAALAIAAACAQIPGAGLAPPRVRRIGYLSGAPLTPVNQAYITAFREGLRDLGYIEGQNLVIEGRHASSDDQLAEPVAELVGLQPEVILAFSSTVARALRNATSSIPVVSAGVGNLVATGVAASHAQPGGNVTGLSTPPLAGKQLPLLREAVPTLSRVLVLYDATFYADWEREREPIEAAARTLGIQVQFAGARTIDDLTLGLEAGVRDGADGLYTSLGPLISANQAGIAEHAVRSRLPSVWQLTDAVARGGFMAYGPNRNDMYRRAATYVDRILRGASPAALPIEEPTRFDFIVNLATARAIGITIPQTVLQQATEVIQ